MKTLVIGHTSGIGEELTQILEADGVSRSTGFDINNRNNDFNYTPYNTIILNAYGDFTSQLQTLYEIIENDTFNKDTLVIVISSIKAWNETPTDIFRSKYAVEKGALNHAIRNLNNLNYNIVSVCPSYVETSFNKGKDLPMMSVQYLALVVDRIVNDFYKFGIKTIEIAVEKVK